MKGVKRSDEDVAAAVQGVLDAAVDVGAAPGFAAAIVDVTGAARTFTSGHRFTASLRGDSSPVATSTVYDLASLTKLLCTTALVAAAVDDDVIALDEEPYPRWSGVTVAHLLQHTAGLCAHRPFHDRASRDGVVGRAAGRDVVVDAVLSTVPDVPPGTRTLYSDLGFIALGALLEERTGDTLDVLFEAHRAKHLSSSSLRFVNLWREGYHPAVPAVAPTERCTWRRRCVLGQVHDENAYAMGGVAGHAGLFGSVDDVAVAAAFFLRELLREGSMLRRFARVDGDRGFGFDKASVGGATGDVFGSAVGHLGFTGTSVWFDVFDGAPEDARAFVLLGNTVHPSREGVLARNKAVRRAFHRAAVVGESVDVVALQRDCGIVRGPTRVEGVTA